MLELTIIVGAGTSIWVFFDAPTHGLSRTWALGCLFLWIVAFPWYLVERSKADRIDAAIAAEASAKPQGGWEPDPRDPERYERWRDGTRWTSRIRERQQGP